MGEGYSNAVIPGAIGFPVLTLTTTTGNTVSVGYSNTGSKSAFPITGIGSDSASGNTVYVVPVLGGRFTVTEFWVSIGGTMSLTTAPVFKFWRRKDATVFGTAAGGTGDTQIFQSDGKTGESLTIPTSAPTPIAGNIYVLRFTGDSTIDPGEAFVVELDTAGDAATVAMLSPAGYFASFDYGAVLPGAYSTAATGVPKVTTNSVGRVYKVLT